MNRHRQLMEPTPAQPASPPRWQADRRSGRHGRPHAGQERRSGADNRRQPRMPAARRPIYPD